MSDGYDVSLREAMTMLGKKAATVRSYVRSGRLSKQYVEGFNGQEMRLNRAELEELKKSLKDTTTQTSTRVSNSPKNRVANNSASEGVSSGHGDTNVRHAIEVLERELAELRKEKEELRHESKDQSEKNFQMAGQLGYYQNQVETLKDQVKQLTAPADKETHKKDPKKGGGLFGLFGLGKR